jgi:hypothetical protein
MSEPRNQCKRFIADRKATGTLLPKAEFDAFARSRSFAAGPYRDTFGDGPFDRMMRAGRNGDERGPERALRPA